MPVRKIEKSYTSLTGVVVSRKNGGSIRFESSLERDLAYLLEFDYTVMSYELQPITIEYLNDNGEKRKYTPDFLVYYNNDLKISKSLKPRLCEVKYRDDLKAKWPLLKPKFKAAIDFAKRKGWDFKIYTEKEIRNDFMLNARFLQSYIRASYDLNHSILLRKTLETLECSTPEELIGACSNDKYVRAQLLHTLWSLVSNGIIGIDLHERIGMDSEIWTNQ